MPTTAMTYEAALDRATMAASFIEHPYWPIVARVLSGTIQSETEQLLVSDEHRDSNRASVAICRKYLNMPFFDIEQGKLVQMEYQKAVAHGRRSTQGGRLHEVQ